MQKKIGLFGAVSTGIGMIIATSCFIPLASGASTVGTTFIFSLVLVCFVNMLAAASNAELNALMPNLTGGLAQYTLVGLGPFVTIVTMIGGYFISNIFAAPAEGAMFANVMTEFLGDSLPTAFYSVTLTIILIWVNLRGVTLSTFVQCVIAVFMVSSLFALGFIGAFGLGTEPEVSQPAVLSWNLEDILPLTTTAFWLFIGSEFIIPLGKDMEQPKRDIPRAMFLSLLIMCIIQSLMVLGFSNYTLWDDVGAADSPHILYAVGMLGSFGRYWMIFVALLAAISTQNSIIGSVAEICCGMAKIGLLPAIFQKKNRHGAPYVVILLLGIATILIEATGLSSGPAIQFLILAASLFWMISYIVTHINVMVLRHAMPTVPRTYKVPGYPVLQIFAIVMTVYMIYHISPDPTERLQIFLLSFVLMLLLALYAFFWVRVRLHLPILHRVNLHKVMAMEDPIYYIIRHNQKASDDASSEKDS
jgi:amino acid transporter